MDNPVYLVEFSPRVWPRFFANGGQHANGSWLNGAARVPVNPTKTYRFTGTVRRVGSSFGVIYAGVALFDSAGNNIAGPSGSTQWLYAAVNASPASWTTYTATFGAGTARTFPAEAATMAPLVILAYGGTSAVIGSSQCKEAWIEDTAAAGVPISKDPYMRDLSAWALFAETAAIQRTEIDATPQTLALRYATAPYVTAAADTPARMPYEARVLQPGMVRSELPADWVGGISSNFGEIVLSNADGALSDWPYMGLDGVQVSVLMGQSTAARSTFVEVIRAAIDQATVDHKSARLRLRGPETALSKPLLPNRYAGSNALPAGLEGTADDLIGLPKPRLYGQVFNIAPPCVNTSRNIYQVHDPLPSRAPYSGVETVTVSEVRVRGLALTAGADYTDQTDMETNAPSAGQYRNWPEGGYFRLGSAPAGQVACDAVRVTQGMAATPIGWSYLFSEIATDAGCADIRADLVAATYGFPVNLNSGMTNFPLAAGLWANDLRTAAEALDQITASAGAWYGYATWDGVPGSQFELGAETFPPAPPVSNPPAFAEGDILQLQAIADPGAGRGVPVWRVDLGYSHNFTPTSGDFDASVSAAVKAQLGSAGKRVQVSDTAVSALHTTAREFKRDTLLVDASDAAAEAERLLRAMMYARLWFSVKVPLAAVLAQTARPRLGGFVRLQWPGLQVLTYEWSPDSGGVITEWGVFTVQTLELDLEAQVVRMTVRQITETYF